MERDTKTVIIFGSSRGDGNTRRVVDEVIRRTGFDMINLQDHEIGYFEYDFKNKGDDFIPIMENVVANYDTIIFATPVYWYTMSAILKTFFDRFSDLVRDRKDIGRQLRGMNMAMISTGHIDDLGDGFSLPFTRSAEYLGMNYLGEMHSWVNADGTLPEVVLERIDRFKEVLGVQRSASVG